MNEICDTGKTENRKGGMTVRKIMKLLPVCLAVMFAAGCQTEKGFSGDGRTADSGVPGKDPGRIKSYVLKTDEEWTCLPKIILYETGHEFCFSYDTLSSYLPHGTWTADGSRLKLETDDGKYCYTFEVADDETLRFDETSSSEISFTDESAGGKIQDGAEFVLMFSGVPEGG